MVDDGDVVAALAAHQSNLTPPDTQPRAVLVALPTPPILRALVGDEVAPLRARWLRAWAERLGGGDGPLPVVNLDEDVRSLRTILQSLERSGARRVYLVGARDQPGFARELACRWSGELCVDPTTHAPDLDGDLAAMLHDTRERTHALGSSLLVAVDEDADPSAVVATLGDGAVAYARDPHRAAGARHGFLPPAALFATAEGNRIRDAWRSYWAARGHADRVREAALGLDPELDERLREPHEPRATTRRARLIAITGLDGSGKSSHVAALCDSLAAAGRRTCALKLYRQGPFLELANELSARTRCGAPMAAFRVSRIVKLIDSLRVYRDQLLPALASCDDVILDRYTETHRAAAASQLGWDLRHHPALAIFPPADVAFWLTLDPTEALGRLHARGATLSADEHAVGLAGYARAFRAIATSPTDVVLDATAPFADNAARIACELSNVSPSRGAEPLVRGAPSVIPAADVPSRRATLLAVTVGGDPTATMSGGETRTLAADIASLAALLRRDLGRAADGIPAAFFIEAYAAELVLDARTTSAGWARIALWPGALRRMRTFADLHALDELTRMLEATVQVEHWSPADDDPLWTVIAPSPTARRRLAAEYADALAGLARDRAGPAGADTGADAGRREKRWPRNVG